LDCSTKPTIQTVGRNDPTARYLSPWWQELGWNRDAARKHPVADGTSVGFHGGPGGFRFGDYWRLGPPMEVLVVAIAVPLLLVVWPL
jgi:hypothetical protein